MATGGVYGALVLGQIAAVCKAHSTIFADMRPLPRVGAFVHVHLAKLRESRATVRAVVRPFSRMDAIVGDQVTALRKSCPTNIADKRLISGVGTCVDV